MARIVILGGGFGGAAAALAAHRLLADHEIVLIDRSAESFLCGVNPAVVVGDGEPLSRSITSLSRPGITMLQAEIEAIDLDRRQVATSQGDVEWDHLVVALGVSYDWDAVPGSAAGYSFYDHRSALRLRQKLADFGGGTIVMGIGGTPYRCPPAPFEAMLAIDEHLRRRGIRQETTLTMAIPEPGPLGVAGPEASNRLRGLLADADIELLTRVLAAQVTPGSMVFADGTTLPADIPITVPVHRMPEVVAASELSQGKPFIPVDRHTLETAVPDVFAIGDINTIPLGENAGIPKAGVFAAGQGRHVAAVIAARLGVGPDPGGYDGVGYCFLMFGRDVGAEVGGDFYAEGGPDVGLGESSLAGRRAKDDWEAAWARFEV